MKTITVSEDKIEFLKTLLNDGIKITSDCNELIRTLPEGEEKDFAVARMNFITGQRVGIYNALLTLGIDLCAE